MSRELFTIRAIERAVAPERVYCLLFGEEASGVHFHLFPRTERLLDEYRAAGRAVGADVDGPDLFRWAREVYSEASMRAAQETAVHRASQRLRELMAERPANS